MDPPCQPRQIPQEIIDIIIDDDTHDEEAYKALSLVSTSFLHQSRRHFFREVTFSGDSDKDRATRERFLEILNNNPDIASYVRNLNITDRVPQERPWIQEEESVQGILLILAKNHISDLTLEVNLFWTSFPAGLKHALTQILTAPSLVKLDLSHLKNIPVSSCTHFPRLQHLRMYLINLVASPEGYYQGEAATVSISSLDIAFLSERKSAWLCRNILGLAGSMNNTLAFLERLKITVCDADFVSEVVRASRKSLRCLTLQTASQDAELINLSELESLQYLELRSYVAVVLDVLETGGPNKELRSLHVTLLCRFLYESWVNHFLNEATGSFWRRLAVALNRFSSLTHLVIELNILRGPGGRHREERMTALKCSVRDKLFSGGENLEVLNRALVVKISEV